MLSFLWQIVVLLSFVLPANLEISLEPGEFCILSKTAIDGKCTRLQECKSALEGIKQGKQPQSCGVEGQTPLVCCEDAEEVKLTKADEKCHYYAQQVLDLTVYPIHSKDAVIQEFPHMAAIGFGNRNNIQWQCGGSLISEQYVLTAAHCLYDRTLGQALWVRLGDLDLDSGSDVKRDYQISRRIFHPDYKPPSVYNDIGLAQLELPVQFTPFIKPACLFADVDLGQYIDLIATGWGLTQLGGDTSTILQKIYLDLFTEEECANTYKDISNSRRLKQGIKHDQQFCAGGRGLEKDTCQSDSGGPIQSFRYNYGLYGIVGISSFGKACGVVNVPGVYTKVSKFVPWIQSVVWP